MSLGWAARGTIFRDSLTKNHFNQASLLLKSLSEQFEVINSLDNGFQMSTDWTAPGFTLKELRGSESRNKVERSKLCEQQKLVFTGHLESSSIESHFRVVKGNQSLGLSLLAGIILLYFTAYFFIFDATDIVSVKTRHWPEDDRSIW